MTGLEYEVFCEDYLRQMGYTGTYVTQASSDYGVDIIGYKYGEKTAVQCKYYSSPVGNKAVQEVYSGMAYYGCSKAVVITNSTFTKNAEELASRLGVQLLDNVKPDTIGIRPDVHISLQGEFPNYRYTDYAYDKSDDDYINSYVPKDDISSSDIRVKDEPRKKRIANCFANWFTMLLYAVNELLSMAGSLLVLIAIASCIADDVSFSLFPFYIICASYVALKFVSNYYLFSNLEDNNVKPKGFAIFVMLLLLSIFILVVSVINSFIPSVDGEHLFLCILVFLIGFTALPNFSVMATMDAYITVIPEHKEDSDETTETKNNQTSIPVPSADTQTTSSPRNTQDVWQYARMCTEEMNRKDKQERGGYN